jgi:hypothetical protein
MVLKEDMGTNYNYLIIPVSELYKVDFSKIATTEPRKNFDDTKCIIKWIGSTPSFVYEINNFQGAFDHDQMMEILKSEEWSWEIPTDEEN